MAKIIKEIHLFTIKEIETDEKGRVKIPGLATVKTLDRGTEFKEERYVNFIVSFCIQIYEKKLLDGGV